MRNSFLKHYPYALVVIILAIVAAGCAGKVNQPVPATVTAASPSPVVPKPATATASPEPVLPQTAATTAPQPTADSHLRYQSNFSDPNSGWPQQKFDNYFIGYHPPSFYHIDIHSANDKRIVPTPDKTSYGDATIETKIYTEPNNTDPNGDFRYGTAFRRSGDQYYAFTISPRTKHWYMLKVSPNEVAVLKEGTEDSIQGLQGEDTLRVDAQGSTFFLRINDHLVGQVSDPDYAKGEVGLYVETFDSPHVHIHFEAITVRDVEAPQPQTGIQYQSNFADPNSGWLQQKFDNYFVGYHAPDYYHIDISSANAKQPVFIPGKAIYGDATIETKIYTEPNNTDPNGDFRYGTAFRRSGGQYYAFAISPRTKHWYMLKVSPSEVAVLKEGTEDSIQGLQGEDILRVDAQGSTFFLRINDHLVGQVSDPDYAKGEVGLYAETFDSPHIHIHFEAITVRDVEAPQLKCDVIATALRVRSGPSTSFDPPILFLPSGASLEAQGRSADGNWIQVKVASSGQAGWVYDSEGILSCNFSVADLPVVSP